MSNGEQSRFAAAAPLVVQRLTQREVPMSMPMKAPSQPGEYTLKFRAMSPTTIGINADFTLKFKVEGEAEAEAEAEGAAKGDKEGGEDAAGDEEGGSKKDN